MKNAGLRGKCRQRKFTPTTDSNHGLDVAPNALNRDFEPPRPNEVWASDITQLWTPQGWLYLAVVLDLFARYVVGWACRADITRQLVIDAVKMAIGRRPVVAGLIFHSDKGSQYAAADTQRLLRENGIVVSMSGTGNCYDNAVSESFFSGFKNELGDAFPSRAQGTTDTFRYIETFFNPYRRHSFNGNVSPRDCEAFFARFGRRPKNVPDFTATAAAHPTAATSWTNTTPSRVLETGQNPVTAAPYRCQEGSFLSI